jgi:signal transduction histidine kinase/tetratricopeptide (TPR) repeat protein
VLIQPCFAGTLHFFQRGQQKETTAATTYYDAGILLLKNNENDSAYTNFIKGHELATKVDNPYLIALGNYHLGVYYYQTKNIPIAITFINDALVSFENQNRKTDASKCYYKLGRIYKNISDFEKALSYSFNALTISEVLKDEKEIVRASTQIGSIYLITGDYKASDYNFNRAFQLQEKNNDNKGLVLTYLNLGALSQKQKKYEEALDYFHSGLDIVSKFSDDDVDITDLKDSQAILYGNIGSTLREDEKYKESLEFLFKALVIKKELRRNSSTAHTCNDIAETYIRMNAYATARVFALEGALLAKNESVNKERWSYYLISKCDYALQNYKSSYDNFQIYNTLKDSVFTIQKAARFNELQIQYDTEKRDYQIKEQERDIIFLDTQNKLKTEILWFGGIGLLALFGLVLALKSRQKAIKDIKQQELFTQGLIEAQENERTRVSKDLHDSVGQQLTFLKKKAQNLEQQELSDLANVALEEVRSISRDLYPATLKQLGLTASIEQLLFDLDGESELFFSVELEDININFNEAETLNLYRFIQESVTNVLKHADAKTLIVNIFKRKNVVEVLIKDNGCGFQTNKGILQNSLGLKTMAERIRILKGKLSIQSTRELGTTILVKIPL